MAIWGIKLADQSSLFLSRSLANPELETGKRKRTLVRFRHAQDVLAQIGQD
jgi:hypothetical protein